MSAWAPLILSSSDPVYRSSVLNHIARNARHLDRRRAAVPEISTRGSPDGPVWLLRRCCSPKAKRAGSLARAGLAEAIDQCVFPDGGVVSRSPVQLMELIALLSQLRQCYIACDEFLPDYLTDALRPVNSGSARPHPCRWRAGRMAEARRRSAPT